MNGRWNQCTFDTLHLDGWNGIERDLSESVAILSECDESRSDCEFHCKCTFSKSDKKVDEHSTGNHSAHDVQEDVRREWLFQRCGGNTHLLKRVWLAFYDEGLHHLAALRRAASIEDREQLAFEAARLF